MQGYLSLVLHAHLPFVRHPEHEKSLEESWLFEAITEAYVPLLQVLESWQRSGITARLALTLSPTLCAMLGDPLLQSRYQRHLDDLIELADKEIHRTLWDKPLNELALFYHQRLLAVREIIQSCRGDLLNKFRQFQEWGQLEILTCAATHALLPLLAQHSPSLRAQILVARDQYRACFGRDPEGIWLPECAYVEQLEPALHEANLKWFIVDTHGLLQAHPRPRYATFAPIFTPRGLAVFGRDLESAKQVWSRQEGYPGDPNYRDFYRDIGFDLDYDYVRPHLPAADQRGFTGIKYYRITGDLTQKALYDRGAALQAADVHAKHFLEARQKQIRRLAPVLGRPPMIVSPYDAELFGHWWYEGPEFLDYFVRKAVFNQDVVTLITPGDYLRLHPANQVATPAPSSWGEEGYWQVWLNEKNEWIQRHLTVAQNRMTQLAGQWAQPSALQERALKQAGRELLLAQASDWPFIIHTGTSPDYARQRVNDHLARFGAMYEQLTGTGIDEPALARMEEQDNLFPEIDYRYWRETSEQAY